MPDMLFNTAEMRVKETKRSGYCFPHVAHHFWELFPNSFLFLLHNFQLLPLNKFLKVKTILRRMIFINTTTFY